MLKNVARIVVLVGLLALSACSSAPATATEPVEEPIVVDSPVPPTPKPSPTPEPMLLPDTPSFAVLGVEENSTYKVEMGSFQPLAFEDSELPAAPGRVEARWYVSGERYVVVYAGLDYQEGDFLCPGNSIYTTAGFQYVSNAPTDEGACEGFPTLTTDPEVGPRVCLDELFYVTAIPSSEQGMLFGTLEALDGEGNLVGLTSAVQSSPDIPEINLSEYCE